MIIKILILLLFVSCTDNQPKDKYPENSDNYTAPEVCEAQLDEASCAEKICTWKFSRRGIIANNICQMTTPWKRHCLSIMAGIENNVPRGYYRPSNDGFDVLFVDDNENRVLGWTPCDEKPGWNDHCLNCDMFD